MLNFSTARLIFEVLAHTETEAVTFHDDLALRLKSQEHQDLNTGTCRTDQDKL